jgi:hypothetical protein
MDDYRYLWSIVCMRIETAHGLTGNVKLIKDK